MKLRLKITTPEGVSRTFEHSGPILRIGRDPECELSLEGADGHAVSWNHARIELGRDGAMVADIGSSNGTLLNDQRINQPTPVRVGDRVQLGHTGATLTITELDLSAPPVQEPPKRRPVLSSIHIAGAVAVGLLITTCLILLNRGSGKSAPDDQTTSPKVPLEPDRKASATPAPKAPQEKVAPPDNQAASAAKGLDPSEIKPPEKRPEPAITEPDEVREVGRYVALPEWGPGLLLQRQGTAYPWTPLRPESRVATAATLVSLPGYRSTLTMDTGVQLTLWGDLPEFSPFPPVLESVVMLNVPRSGVDLDVTLERGRIHLVNLKSAGASRIELRFLRQSWQLTLPEPGSEACAELWPLLGQGATSGKDPVAPIVVGLFVKGKARLEAAGQTLELADRSRVRWVNVSGSPPRQESITQLPAWWTKPPDRSQPQVADAMISLQDWSGYLSKSKEFIVDTILTQVRESKDSKLRALGLLFLAALDEMPFLVEFLEERQHAEVRGTARHALQVWLSRGPNSQAELARILKEKQGYSPEKGALIGRLLQRIPDADLAKPETYQSLIRFLDHENLIVRDLAFWHLAQLVPSGAASIAYDPAAEADQRRKHIAQWQKIIPPGKVPEAPAKDG
jgi:hypothetical protein